MARPITYEAKLVQMLPDQLLNNMFIQPGFTDRDRAALKQIFFSWPNLQPVIFRLARLIGFRFPVRGQTKTSLFSKALGAAMARYADAHRTNQFEVSPVGAFLEALILQAGEIARFDVYGIDQEKASTLWTPSEEGLPEFAQKFVSVVFQPTEATEDTLSGTRLILASRVMTVDDAHLVAVFNTFVTRKGKNNVVSLPTQFVA